MIRAAARSSKFSAEDAKSNSLGQRPRQIVVDRVGTGMGQTSKSVKRTAELGKRKHLHPSVSRTLHVMVIFICYQLRIADILST
jgi:hypothetical protein